MSLKKYEYFKTDNGVLYCGDCYEILNHLDIKDDDILITDPPYNMHVGGGGLVEKRKIFKNLVNMDITNGYNYDILNKFKNIVIFASIRQLPDLLNIVKTKNAWGLLTLIKKNPPPLTNNVFLPDTEYIVYGLKTISIQGKYKDKFKYIMVTVKANKYHPAEKEDFVMDKLLINFKPKENGVVYDIFAGSGSTLLACEKKNIKWVGIEIDKNYCEIIKQRMNELYNNLFKQPLK